MPILPPGLRDLANNIAQQLPLSSVTDVLSYLYKVAWDTASRVSQWVLPMMGNILKLFYTETFGALWLFTTVYDATTSLIASIKTRIGFLLHLIRQLMHGSFAAVSTGMSYVLDEILNQAHNFVWRGFIYSLNQLFKYTMEPPGWLKRALQLQLGEAVGAACAVFPAAFWLQGLLEFMRTGVWDLTAMWTWAGYDIFELVTIAKRWKCWPVTKKYLDLYKETIQKSTELVSKKAKDVDKLLPVTFYNRFRGAKNSAYKVSYMLEELLHDEEIRQYIEGDEEAPPKGLFLSSYGCNLIYHPFPVVRRLIKLDCVCSKIFGYYLDDVGRIWLKFDGYGTFDDGDFDFYKNYHKPSGILLKGDRTWIEDGVKGTLDLMEGDLRFVTLRLKSRARRLFSDIYDLLYPILWSRNLRERGINVPQVPATAIHLDCIERHYRYFKTL